MPEVVVDLVAYALHLAQTGLKYPQTKVLKGYSDRRAYWKWLKTMITVRCIRCGSRMLYTSCTAFKRNRTRGLKLRNAIWT